MNKVVRSHRLGLLGVPVLAAALVFGAVPATASAAPGAQPLSAPTSRLIGGCSSVYFGPCVSAQWQIRVVLDEAGCTFEIVGGE